MQTFVVYTELGVYKTINFKILLYIVARRTVPHFAVLDPLNSFTFSIGLFFLSAVYPYFVFRNVFRTLFLSRAIQRRRCTNFSATRPWPCCHRNFLNDFIIIIIIVLPVTARVTHVHSAPPRFPVFVAATTGDRRGSNSVVVRSSAMAQPV